MEGISIRMVRNWDVAIENASPSFDHIPTEAGREASRKLWEAAHGKPQRQNINRLDVLYGFGCIAPNIVVTVTG